MLITEYPAVLERRLSALLELIRPQPRPRYHAFEYKGTRLVYDILTGSLMEPEPLAFDILVRIERGQGSQEILDGLESSDRDRVESVIDDLESLHAVGLLQAEPDYSAALKSQIVTDLVSHRPRKMMLMVQSNCNLKCTYCYEVINGFHSTGKRMDSETGRQSVDFLIQRSGGRRDLEVTFFGGEPLMNFPLIRELVAYCRSREAATGKRFEFQITTNCTLLDDEVIAFLVEHQFAVMASLDGPPDMHDIHRKDLHGNGTGAVALANAKRLVAAQKAAGVRECMVRVTMTHENHDGRGLNEFFTAEGFSRIMLGASDGRVDSKESWDLGESDMGEMHAQSEESVLGYLDWIDGRAPRPSDAPQVARNLGPILEALRDPNPMPKIRCGVARNMQAITRDGKIYPCHRYAGEDAFQLGTLEGGLNAESVRRYYDALLQVKERHCSHCWARITCGGQCPWYISKETGEIADPDEASCNGIRQGHERQLWLVHQLKRRGKLSDVRAEVDREAQSEPT